MSVEKNSGPLSLDVRVSAGAQLSNSTRAQVYALLEECSQEFVPPLTQRLTSVDTELQKPRSGEQSEDGVKKYFDSLLSQEFLLAFSFQSKLVGFMSVRPHHVLPAESGVSDEVVYLTTVLVSPLMRRKGIMGKLYSRLYLYADKLGKPVATRTWSANEAHLIYLNQNGFKPILKIEGDRGEGVSTLYFLKNING